MTSEVRAYLESVVSEISTRHKRRGWTTGKKQWELRLLAGARKLLREEQTDLVFEPRRVSDAELNEAVRQHSHAGLV